MNTITIHRNDRGAFLVLHGEKFADSLTFDEMLGLVAALTVPPTPRSLCWLRSADELRERVASVRGFGVGGTGDDADERVRGDWSAVEAGGEAPPVVVEAVLRDGPSGTEITLPPPASIKRDAVVLKVGDKVKLRDGRTDIVLGTHGNSSYAGHSYPVDLEFFAGIYQPNGRYNLNNPTSAADITEVNGVRIIDAED